MNVHKKLLSILMRLTCVAIYIQEDQYSLSKPTKNDMQTMIQGIMESAQEQLIPKPYLTDEESALIELRNDNNFKKNIKDDYKQICTQLEHLAMAKKNLSHPSFRTKLSINFVEEYLLERKKQFYDIDQFITQEEISPLDIKNFLPQFINFLNSLNNQSYDSAVHSNLYQLYRLQNIKKKRRAHLEHSLPRKSFAHSEILQQNIDQAIFTREMQEQENQFMYKNHPDAFYKKPTKYSPLTNFAKNTQFAFDKSSDQNIRKACVQKIQKTNYEQQFQFLQAWYGGKYIDKAEKEIVQEHAQRIKTSQVCEGKFIDEAQKERERIDSCYKTLGVAKNASEKDLDRAYKKSALICHPDRDKNNPHATHNFQELNEAYNTLKDWLSETDESDQSLKLN